MSWLNYQVDCWEVVIMDHRTKQLQGRWAFVTLICGTIVAHKYDTY